MNGWQESKWIGLCLPGLLLRSSQGCPTMQQLINVRTQLDELLATRRLASTAALRRRSGVDTCEDESKEGEDGETHGRVV
jgi:hypothetical protein